MQLFNRLATSEPLTFLPTAMTVKQVGPATTRANRFNWAAIRKRWKNSKESLLGKRYQPHQWGKEYQPCNAINSTHGIRNTIRLIVASTALFDTPALADEIRIANGSTPIVMHDDAKLVTAISA